MHMMQVVRFCLAGHCGAVWKAKTQALRAVLKMWRKRRTIQVQRAVSAAQIWRLLDKRLVPKRCG
jgi:hypothetical protein